MIIKFDHIALYSNHLEKTRELLKCCGYQEKFTEVNLINPEIKRTLMTDFSDLYGICYMSHEKNVDIEIVTAEVSSNNYAYLKPIIIGIEHDICIENEMGLEKSLNELIEMQPLTDNNISNFETIMCRVGSIENSILFWKLFGFVEESMPLKKSMVYKSILPNQKGIQLVFNEVVDNKQKYHLNDIGFNCLAFITTSIDKDRNKFVKNGFRSTSIEQIQINGRLLRVCFVIGNNGELAELIELQKES